MKALFCKADWQPKEDYPMKEFESSSRKAFESNKVWKNPKLILRNDIEQPKPKRNELLIEVKACGICGSDLLFTGTQDDGYMKYPGHSRMNIILGHEFSGIVVELGKDVAGFEIGDAVCSEERVWCGECVNCKNGFLNQCEHVDELGVTVNGGFASYVTIPAKLAWKLNDMKKLYGETQELYNRGAMVQPCSVAYNAIFGRGQVLKPGAYSAVFGAGPIGLLCVTLLKIAGAAKVIVLEPENTRLALSKPMGADILIDTSELSKLGISASEAILQHTNGQGADILIDAAGVSDILIPEMIKAMGVNAQIILAAMNGKPVPVMFPPLQRQAGHIVGSVGDSGNANFQNVIRLMSSGQLDPAKILSTTYKLSEGIEAFNRAHKRKDAKIIIIPD